MTAISLFLFWPWLSEVPVKIPYHKQRKYWGRTPESGNWFYTDTKEYLSMVSIMGQGSYHHLWFINDSYFMTYTRICLLWTRERCSLAIWINISPAIGYAQGKCCAWRSTPYGLLWSKDCWKGFGRRANDQSQRKSYWPSYATTTWMRPPWFRVLTVYSYQ